MDGHWRTVSSIGALAFTVSIAGSLVAQQRQPQFRTRTDLIALDVSVLDRKRQPVRGLTPSDFVIKEDGKLQMIETFAAVDIPDPVPPTAGWMRDIAPDVQSNQIDDHRVVVFVLDNWSGPLDTWEGRTGRRVAHDIVDRLGPADVAAVLVLYGTEFAQDFTQDRQLLSAAIDQKQSVLSPASLGPGVRIRDTYRRVMQDVVNYLADLPDRRKALIYVGQGTEPNFREAADLINDAKRANVNIYCFDLNGLVAPVPDPMPGKAMILDPRQSYREEMVAISNATGGDATVNTNRPTDEVPQIFVENGSYYLLGYVSTNQNEDGRLRRISVSVDRSGVSVRNRRGYYASERGSGKNVSKPPAVTQSAIAGLLPQRAVTLEAVAAPFAASGRKEAAIATTVGLMTAAGGSSATNEVEVLVRAFTPVGDARGQQVEHLRVPNGTEPGTHLDVLTQIGLEPGRRYELRISVRDLALERTGSVYTFLDVPDFARDPLSLSGLVLTHGNAEGGPRAALRDLVPVIPTTRRSFVKSDLAAIFLRVYQGGQRPPRAATLTMHIVDDHDRRVFERSIETDANRFTGDVRAAEYLLDLPLTNLSPGHYLAVVAASLESRETSQRELRFNVRAN